MKKVITLALALIVTPIIASGQSLSSTEIGIDKFQQDPLKEYLYSRPNNPCKNSLYVKLKNIPLDEMTDRQYEVFKQKDKACQAYLTTVESTEAEKQNAQTLKKANNALTAYYVIGGISLLASTIFILTL